MAPRLVAGCVLVGLLLGTPLLAQPGKLPEHAVCRLGLPDLTPQSGVGSFHLAYLPDGKHLLTGGNRRPAQFWETASGQERPLVPGLPQLAEAFALSADGGVLALAVTSKDQPTRSQLQLFSTRTGKLLQRFKEQPWGYWVLAFSPDGKLLASRGLDALVRVWDIQSGAVLHELPADSPGEHTGQPQVAFAADGDLLATLGRDHGLRVYSLATGKEVPHFGGRQGHVMALAVTPDGKQLVTGQADYSIKLWDAATGMEVRRLLGHKHWPTSLALSANGKLLASADAPLLESNLRLWDLETGKELHKLKGPHYGAYSLALSPDGKQLAASGFYRGKGTDTRIRLWDTTSGKPLFPDDPGELTALAYAPDGRTLLAAGANGLVRAWDMPAAKERFRQSELPAKKWTAVAFAPEGEVAIAVGERGLQLWETESGKLRRDYPLAGVARALSFNGSRVAYLDSAKTLRIIEVDTGQPLYSWKVDSHINAAAFSGQQYAALILAGPINRPDRPKVSLHRLRDGKKLLEFTAEQRAVTGLMFSADGRSLAATCTEGLPIRLWETATGQERQVLAPQAPPSWGLSNPILSPDGTLLAAATRINQILLLDVTTGQPLGSLSGHGHPVRDLAFSPDSRFLASSALDILVWNLAELRPVLPAIKPGTDQELEDRWVKLAEADATPAFVAIGELARQPGQSTTLLRARLLESVQGTAAARARNAPEPPLTSLDLLRIIRGIEALERIGSPEAAAALQDLAKAAPDSWLAQDIQAALQRIRNRNGRQ